MLRERIGLYLEVDPFVGDAGVGVGIGFPVGTHHQARAPSACPSPTPSRATRRTAGVSGIVTKRLYACALVSFADVSPRGRTDFIGEGAACAQRALKADLSGLRILYSASSYDV